MSKKKKRIMIKMKRLLKILKTGSKGQERISRKNQTKMKKMKL